MSVLRLVPDQGQPVTVAGDVRVGRDASEGLPPYQSTLLGSPA